MEFGERLRQLRKSRGLTQAELADALYVSRTAVSKWESGRGYPGIDSLKEISGFFTVSIDDLLSCEKILSIAEQEKKKQLRDLCDRLVGMVDLCSFLLILLPIYPKTGEAFVYSVNLFQYSEAAKLIRVIYWILFLGLMLTGTLKLLTSYLQIGKNQKILTLCSMALSIAAVFVLALTRGTYAVSLVFLLLILKGSLLYSCVKAA
jgi:transcriptional regulator with XRE-family HTH domain